MERKIMVNPASILKMTNFLTALEIHIVSGDSFSINKLVREFNLGGSTGTAVVRLGFIEKSADKMNYILTDKFGKTKEHAIFVIEYLRLHSSKNNKKQKQAEYQKARSNGIEPMEIQNLFTQQERDNQDQFQIILRLVQGVAPDLIYNGKLDEMVPNLISISATILKEFKNHKN